MKGKAKSLICLVLTLAVILSGMTIPSGTVSAAEAKEGTVEYKIYPTPQSLQYKEGNISLPQEVNVVYEAGIDEATKNRLNEVMQIKDIDLQLSDKAAEGKTNILIGTANSGGIADLYAKEQLSYASDLFGKPEAYLLSIEDNTITILGKDTDAAYYAISSLKMIFNQSEGRMVRKLHMEDYSIGQYRGFIEGYYGIPWSVEDRISLMNFGSDFKMNIYIFAPKDDPYHNKQWRDLYPEDKLAEIKAMVDAGTASKCRFAWAIHPFMNSGINLSNYDESLEVIKAKFQQLYDVGVRQFVISADDAGSKADVHVKLLNDMNQWMKEHEGTYNLVFVPMIYCTGAANWGYGYTLQQYYDILKAVDSDVEFMWTGESVCSPATQSTFTHFKNVSGRDPFMWLNWPVNDVNHKRLVMGPAENCILNTGGVTGFKGIVTNPLEQAEASKTSLFAIADYAWNTADFNSQKSWEDSFQYIDEGAPQSLAELCKHMTNPKPGGITAMAESKEIKPYITAFQGAHNSGADLSESGNELVGQFEKIVTAADDFQKNGTNEKLKEEMEPWVNSLRAVSNAGIGYVKAAIALQKEDYNEAWANYCMAINEFQISKNCEAPQLEGTIFVESGAEVLIPFAVSMDHNLKKPMQDMLKHTFGGSTAGGGTVHGAALIYQGLGGLYQGKAENITDGNDESYAWFNENVAVNGYIGLDLGDQYQIDSVKILQGKNATDGDIFSSAILEYSVDGENYTALETISNTNNIQKDLSGLSIVGRYIRIRTAAATGKWYAIREFSASTSPAETPAYTNAEELELMKASITKNAASIITTEEAITLKQGEYLGLQLPKIREVTSVTATYAPENDLILEYSLDGIDWTEMTEFEEPVDLAYLRIRNKGTKSVTFTLSEFSIINSDQDATLVSTTEWEEGFDPAFAADNSLTTAYRAKAGSGGSLTWRISKPEKVGYIYILTYPGTSMDASVEIQDQSGAWHKSGTLNQNLNIFKNLEKYETIKSVRVSWSASAPQIQEMYTVAPRNLGITLNKTSSLLGIDRTLSLKAEVLVLETEDKTVTWSSDHPEIASVDEFGTVTGKVLGSARITASAEKGKYTAFCDIVVTDRDDPQDLAIKSASAGSEEIAQGTATEGSAALAIDGDQNTKWHSLWDGDSIENLWITLDLGETRDVSALKYQPRQDKSANGTILGYQIFTSLDGEEWLLADQGEWPEDREWKQADMKAAVPARYVKLAATDVSTDQNAKFASAAEIKILGFEHDENIVDKRYAIAACLEKQITPEDKYTEVSYQNYMDTWDTLKEVTENVVSTQEQVDDAVEAYRQAIKNLKIKVTGISLTPSSLTLEPGDTETLEVRIQPSDAGDQSVDWSSEDPAIASVDTSGKVTAKAAGSTEITVSTKDGNYRATCKVTVNRAPIPVTGVDIGNVPGKALEIGERVTLTAQIYPLNADNQKVSWLSSNPGVAAVDQTGNVTAAGEGTADISATTEDGGYTQKITITVRKKEIIDPVVPAPELKAPKQVQGLNWKNSSTSAITLSWNKAEGADSYILERYDPSSKKWTVALNTTATTVKDIRRKAGIHYKYRVTAVNKAGKSAVSSILNAATKPKNTTITKRIWNKKTKKVLLKWKQVKADGYGIYVRAGKGKFELRKTLKKNSYPLKLKKGKKYAFKIRPFVNNSGKRVWGSYSKINSLNTK